MSGPGEAGNEDRGGVWWAVVAADEVRNDCSDETLSLDVCDADTEGDPGAPRKRIPE